MCLKRQTILCLCLLYTFSLHAANYSPTQTAKNLNNPHKGFMLWGTDYADGAPNNYYGSTIYHIYAPWREIETSDQVFDWGAFETNHILPILTGHPSATFVLRPVADYPDGENSGITLFYSGELQRDFPRFLIEPPLSIAYDTYTSCDGDGPGWTPDWNDPAMSTQLVQFVEAFGERYDGDPRITAVQVGLLGLWGEWHQSGCEEHAPSNAVKEAVRDAYAAAFTNTPLQTRYPRDPDAVGVEFGFHEDYFPSFTAPCIYGFPGCSDDGDWSMYYCFVNITTSSVDNWKSNPVSGESPTAGQRNTWSNDFDDVMTVLRDYHFSFLGPAGGHEKNGNQAKLNPMKRLLGYNYHIERVDWPETIYPDHSFQVSLLLTNSGAAPCYHPFPVELSLCDTNGTPQWTANFRFDLRTVTPVAASSNVESFTVMNISTGVYSLRIGILDPRTGQPGVRIQSVGEDSGYRIEIGDIAVCDPWLSDVDDDGLPDEWEYRYFGNYTSAVSSIDGDDDGYPNGQEYVADTDPTNKTSFLSPITMNRTITGLAFEMDLTSTARIYHIERASDLLHADWNAVTSAPGTGGAWMHERAIGDESSEYFRDSVTLP